MSFRNAGEAANELQMAERAQVSALGFEGLLGESQNPSKEVQDFCTRIREISSFQGKVALEQWGANSSDFIHLAGWMNTMVAWLKHCEVFGNLIGLSRGDSGYIRCAAHLMGHLHTWSQTISLVLPVQQDQAA